MSSTVFEVRELEVRMLKKNGIQAPSFELREYVTGPSVSYKFIQHIKVFWLCRPYPSCGWSSPCSASPRWSTSRPESYTDTWDFLVTEHIQKGEVALEIWLECITRVS